MSTEQIYLLIISSTKERNYGMKIILRLPEEVQDQNTGHEDEKPGKFRDYITLSVQEIVTHFI